MNTYNYGTYGGVEWSLGDLWKGVRNWAKGATKTAGKVAGKVINLGRNVVKKTEYAVLKKAYEELKKLRRARLIIIKKYGRRLPKRLLKLHNKLEKLFQKIRRKMESLQVEDVEAVPAAVIVGGVVVASVAATAVGWYMMQAKKMEIQFKREALASLPPADRAKAVQEAFGQQSSIFGLNLNFDSDIWKWVFIFGGLFLAYKAGLHKKIAKALKGKK